MELEKLENKKRKNKYVFLPSEDTVEDCFGTKMKGGEFDLKGYEQGGGCFGGKNKMTVKYIFYTEGILEIKRVSIFSLTQCFRSTKIFNWKFYPRSHIQKIEVSNITDQQCGCFGSTDQALFKIITTGESDTTDSDVFGFDSCCGFGASKYVAVKMTPEATENLYFFSQNYLFYQEFNPLKIYGQEFLKTITSGKYNINPTDWMNYMISAREGGLLSPVPIPQPIVVIK